MLAQEELLHEEYGELLETDTVWPASVTEAFLHFLFNASVSGLLSCRLKWRQ